MNSDNNAASDSMQLLEHELLTLLRQVRRASVARARSIHPDLQLGGYTVLIWLSAHDRARSADVANALDIDKGAVSRQINHLQRLGLVERVGDPYDKRAHELHLTSAGAECIGALRARAHAELQESLAAWTTQDIADFAGFLRRYNTSRAVTSGDATIEP